MSIDLTTPRSRRALLGAVIGGLAATAANALNGPRSVLATDGQPILQGVDNGGSASTIVRSNSVTALQGVTDVKTGANYGVRGRTNSPSGAGVVGTTFATGGNPVGVLGTSANDFGIGVKGNGGSYGVQGFATRADGGAAGVFGRVDSALGSGVFGENTSQDPQARGIIARGFGVGLDAEAEGSPGSIGVRGKSWSFNNGIGLKGTAFFDGTNSIGVLGAPEGTTAGVRGVVGVAVKGCGVEGWSGGLTPPIAPSNTGVSGLCDTDALSTGVAGTSLGGTGVRGVSASGIGLAGVGLDDASTALKVTGKAVFSRSGKATVATGQSQVTVNGVPLTSSSLVLATIQGSGAAGLYVRNVSVSVANSRFTIRLSKAVTANTLIGWFIVN